MLNQAHWIPKSTGWIFSAKNDLLLFVFPLIIGLLIVFGLEYSELGPSHLFNIGGTQIYARITWVDWLFTALIDAPHAFSTGYRIFSDPAQLRKQSSLFIGLPIAVVLTLIFAFKASELWTFRAITYLNIYHLIKQQYGWIRYSEIQSNISHKINKRLLSFMIYNFTLVPILLWHFDPAVQNRVGWIFQNDLLTYPSENIFSILMIFHWLLNGFFIFKIFQHLRKGHSVSMGQVIVLGSTWLAWYGGIVLKIGGDETLLIDILHVVPYLGLTFFVYKKQIFEVKKTSFISFYFPLALLGLIGTSLYTFYTTQNNMTLGLIVLSCLAGISVTHYILDGFIWRLNQKNPAVEKWLSRTPGLGSTQNSPQIGSIASGQ